MEKHSAEQELHDMAVWWKYNRNSKMDPVQFVDFMDKFVEISLRFSASMLERVHELEDKRPNIVLPTGLKLNDNVRA